MANPKNQDEEETQPIPENADAAPGTPAAKTAEDASLQERASWESESFFQHVLKIRNAL